MRNLIVCFFLMIILQNVSFSKTIPRFGIIATAGNSDVVDDSYNLGSRFSYQIGGVFKAKPSEYISLQVEMNLCYNGAEGTYIYPPINSYELPDTLSVLLEFSYLNFPFELKFTFLGGDNLTNITCGFYYGIRLTRDMRIANFKYLVENLKDFDLGYMVGGDIGLTKDFAINLRYMCSLTSITSKVNFRNTMLHAGLVYYF